MSSAMDVDGAPDSGVEEMKGESATVSSTDASATATAAETSHQKGKGEGDRNVMLHPVCSLIPTHEIIGGCRGCAIWLLVSVFSSFFIDGQLWCGDASTTSGSFYLQWVTSCTTLR